MSIELVLGLVGYACAVTVFLLFAWALCRAAHEGDVRLQFGADPDRRYYAHREDTDERAARAALRPRSGQVAAAPARRPR